MEVVYFIVCDEINAVKIGLTSKLRQRYDAIRCAMPYPCRVAGWMNGGRKDEIRLHRKFLNHRMKGEWFRWEESLQDFAHHELIRPVELTVFAKSLHTVKNRPTDVGLGKIGSGIVKTTTVFYTHELADMLNVTASRVLQLATECGIRPVAPAAGRRSHLWHAAAADAMRDRQTRPGPRGPRRMQRSR